LTAGQQAIEEVRVSTATQEDGPAPPETGIGYIAGGFAAGFGAFVPALLLVWLTLGCYSENGVCEFGVVAAITTLLAFVALIAPIVGGSISAARGTSDALGVGVVAGCLTVVAQWVLVLGVLA
jgi:hypothetical protein